MKVRSMQEITKHTQNPPQFDNFDNCSYKNCISFKVQETAWKMPKISVSNLFDNL